MSSLLAAFFVETVIITYRAHKRGINVPSSAPLPLPLPSEYTSAVIAFGALSVLPRSIDPIPGLIGWGLVLATLLNLWQPGGQTVKPATPSPLTALPQPAKAA